MSQKGHNKKNFGIALGTLCRIVCRSYNWFYTYEGAPLDVYIEHKPANGEETHFYLHPYSVYPNSKHSKNCVHELIFYNQKNSMAHDKRFIELCEERGLSFPKSEPVLLIEDGGTGTIKLMIKGKIYRIDMEKESWLLKPYFD